MKENTLVMVEFTGRITENKRIFDTTSEKLAKEAGIYRENSVFKAVPVVVGNGDVLKGMDAALKEMKVGEEKTIKLGPKDAFGERKKEMIVVVPMMEFKKRKIQPFPGLIVDLNGNYGRIQTVSGGRVRVDLNNDLAGKEVEYELKIVDEIKEPEEKAKVLTQKFFPFKDLKTKVRLEKDTLKVEFPKEIAEQLKPMMAPYTKAIKEVIPEIKKVEVTEPKEAKKVLSSADAPNQPAIEEKK